MLFQIQRFHCHGYIYFILETVHSLYLEKTPMSRTVKLNPSKHETLVIAIQENTGCLV
jgi:hypothetical protein